MSPTRPLKEPDGDGLQAKRAKILEIQRDASLSEAEKNRRVQALHGTNKWLAQAAVQTDPLDGLSQEEKESVTCGICLDIVKRPVTLNCQHNMCLECLQGIRRMAASMRKCPYCRKDVQAAFIDSARINMSIVSYVRTLKAKCAGAKAVVAARVHRATREDEEERPDEAFVTKRAVRNGLANACSGSLKMTCPPDHFGPIGPEFDPKRNRGLVVGDMFPNRMACRMWNAHLPHVAGIAGQSDRGAQSVVLSGGYEDDVDEGEFFLYTGSGGKDLSGNKRNGAHDKDQEFIRYNMALKKSCEEGLPVRVIRSHKERRSAYAPKPDSLEELQGAPRADKDKKKMSKKTGGGEGGSKRKAAETEDEEDEEEEKEEGDGGKDEAADSDAEQEAGDGGNASGGGSRQVVEAKAFNPVRYDGIYRVHACWRVQGAANYRVCRYLIVRCDNAPAPWSSDDSGDKPRMEIPERAAKEIKEAEKLGEEVTYMTKTPYWDYDPVTGEWGWTRPQPVSRPVGAARAPKQGKPLEKQLETAQRELKRAKKQLTESHGCALCHEVATRPVYTACAHMFCMDCLKANLDGGDGQARHNSRPSRSASQRKPCPARGCSKDLSAFMRDVQVNTTMASQAAAAVEDVKRKQAEVAALQLKMEGRDPQDELAAASTAATEATEAAEAKADKSKTAAAAKDSAGGAAPAAAAAEPIGQREAAARPTDKSPTAAFKLELPEADASPAAEKAAESGSGSGTSSINEATGAADGRWRAEASSLALRYPDFDVALISGMLEDQGGDADEVEAFLKRIKCGQQKRAAHSPGQQEASADNGGGDGGAKRGGGKRSRKKNGAGGRMAAAAAKASPKQRESEDTVGAEAVEDAAIDAETEEAVGEMAGVDEGLAGKAGGGKGEVRGKAGKVAPKAKAGHKAQVEAAKGGAKAIEGQAKGKGAAAAGGGGESAAAKRRKVTAP